MEDEPAPPASLVAHGHEIIVLIAGLRARTVARRQIATCAKPALRRLPKVASTFGPCARNAINDNPAPTVA
jgi:hypothetical protein